jgi:hypothetical protein
LFQASPTALVNLLSEKALLSILPTHFSIQTPTYSLFFFSLLFFKYYYLMFFIFFFTFLSLSLLLCLFPLNPMVVCNQKGMRISMVYLFGSIYKFGYGWLWWIQTPSVVVGFGAHEV